MKLTDEGIKVTLENGGYIRRPVWLEKTACYRLAYDETMEFGYYHDGKFKECTLESDSFGIGYEDIIADDWVIVNE